MEYSGTVEDWNVRIGNTPHAQFLQSYEWGVFQNALGRRVWYLDDETHGVQCLAVAYPLKGSMFYIMCPRGPLGAVTDDWWRTFRSWATNQGAVFARVEPVIGGGIAAARRVIDVEPSTTRIIDISVSHDTLLTAMHPKTRYNINLSQKKGVKVSIKTHGDITDHDVNVWWDLSMQTASRNQISVHAQEYYKLLFEIFPYIRLYQASLDGEVIAMAVMVGFGDTMYYLYGASASRHKEVMAPHAIQWHAISDAKNAGYHYYDFWGIAPDENSSHPLAGVTRFKKGFGGEVIALPGTFDMPIRTIPYALYTVMRKIKRSL